MEDRKIIELLFLRAESALQVLAERYGKGLGSMIRSILRSPEDTEECLSDTWLALWNAIPPARPDPLSAYVYRVGRNQALKRLRTQTAQKRSAYELSLDELAEAIPDTSALDALEARELGQAIDRYLATLSQENRTLFLRRYWFGDSLPELAKRQSLRENTLSVRLSRLRAGLRAYLSKEGYL